jgi:hypothetical protein
MLREPTPNYLARNSFRAGRGFVLGLSPEQEKELADHLSRYGDKNTYDKEDNNCTDPLNSGLGKILHYSPGRNPVPGALAEYIQFLAIGETYHDGPLPGLGPLSPVWSKVTFIGLWSIP